MTNVYIAEHFKTDSELNTSGKVIGIFISLDMAEAAVQQVSGLPGFCKYPDGFYIGEYTVDRVNWATGFGIED
jgi:hypothetical protein